MSSRIPPLIEPYLPLPTASLTLITSVLGASSNWLLLRFLYNALLYPNDPAQEDTKVLLLSFMRDLAFWKENARRLGLDLDKLAAKRRFLFLDGLTGLYLPRTKPSSQSGEKTLQDPSLKSIEAELNQAIQGLSEGGGKVVLLVDQFDSFLATNGQVNDVELNYMLLGLREQVHATVMTLSADQPLVSSNETPLESQHAAFLLSIAHQANVIMGLRLLDTGTARDVSGVMRISLGKQDCEEEPDPQKRMEERELLYFVGGDGSVKVFERGQ
ncbi:hypothetical protein B0O99DRAFT_680792 [Bisporella sp. PMI_857]|nr:hypothetical protein B0O99DRAFT_680792 [Bisporella sp. PMI_857]